MKTQIEDVVRDEIANAKKEIGHMEKLVAIFGGARMKEDSPEFELVKETSKALVKAGFATIAGGGPGAMYAVSLGTHEANCDSTEIRPSVGLCITLPFEQGGNDKLTHTLMFETLAARKLVFGLAATSFIAAPGGYGTLDEIFTILTLVQCKKMPAKPFVLLGAQYWAGLLDWLKSTALKQGLISEADLSLFVVLDTPFEVVQFMQSVEHRQNGLITA